MFIIDSAYSLHQDYMISFNEILAELNFTSGYITPLVKHSDKSISPISPCYKLLPLEIEIIKPKLIVALGKNVWSILNPDIDSQIYRKRYTYKDIPVYNTYHPEYALIKNKSKYELFIEDLKIILKEVTND